MNDFQKAKIKRFVDDEVMSFSVFKVIKDSFLKRKGQKDVYILAAERLAFDLLEDAWRELEKYSMIESEKESQSKQVGL